MKPDSYAERDMRTLNPVIGRVIPRKFVLLGPDGLIPYDYYWRQRKMLSEFEPSTLFDRPLTEAEKRALTQCETNIEYISGKPGGGKSMFATKMVVDELLHGHRMIVTNLALNLGRLQEYIHELGGTAHVVDRVRLLKHEEVFKFYTIRGHNVVVKEPEGADDLFDFSESQQSYESSAGVFYVIDECHNYFSTERKIDASSPMFKWASQHRKLKDYCYFVTQSIENVNAKVRRLGQQFNYIRNLRKETFRGFRRGDGFKRTVYLHIPTSESSVCIHQGDFSLDVSGLASCYFTAGGVGVKAFGVADGGFQKKGLHLRWIWVAFFVGLLAVTGVLFLIPWLFTKGAEAVFVDNKKEAPKVAAPAAVIDQEKAPAPAALASDVRQAPADAYRARTNDQGEQAPYATGYVIARGMINITMSDGTIRTERDSELKNVQRNSVTLGDEKIFFKGLARAPRDSGFSANLPPATTPAYVDSANYPPPPSPGQPSWQMHSDGVERMTSTAETSVRSNRLNR